MKNQKAATYPITGSWAFQPIRLKSGEYDRIGRTESAMFWTSLPLYHDSLYSFGFKIVFLVGIILLFCVF
jgi:hypothetical protein